MSNKHLITRTVSIKLLTNLEQHQALVLLQREFGKGCNIVSGIAFANQCYNRVSLHHLSYYVVRNITELGSQMTCNSIQAVANANKVLKNKKYAQAPFFKSTSSIHYDKRTYSITGKTISLYTLSGRIHIAMQLGDFQRKYLQEGTSKEAQLVYRKGQWFFNLVVDLLPPAMIQRTGKVFAVDLGENNLATTSEGKIYKGYQLRHERYKYVALRRRLLSNGSPSAMQRLRGISGREALRVKHENHVISKQIVETAVSLGCDTIAMEDLTNIRKRIKAGKRVRFRLHGWPWKQLQSFIEYKARAKGIKIVYVSPAYTSKTCAECGGIGNRSKHRFTCKFCGIQRHSDLNASHNIRRIAISADVATGTVNYPHV